MIDYRSSGVNRDEGYRTVASIKEHSKRTSTDGVLSTLGGFAALFELKDYKEPVLVSGTDGVGTKLKIAFELGIYDTVGIDCVAMCVNDILCHGAKPLFFLDYLACGKLKSEEAAAIVKGIADGCLEAGCALTGGETAEMPGFYSNGEYDIAGFAVGAVEKSAIIDGSTIREGDLLIGLDSLGIHSNGFSLVRKLVDDLNDDFMGKPIGPELLKPTAIYVRLILNIFEKIKIKGMAHITGGGLYENVPRMFRPEYEAVIEKKKLNINPVFEYLMDKGVTEDEMFHTFNMGTGFVICIDPADEEEVLSIITASDFMGRSIGYVRKGEDSLCLV
ncbi:MAG: phosphoribosylformylglycinamidine cyclo-ligase [Spirochaetia bacterium]|jgi:phosphoribosylformylglycinamidine cyclo-ligase|nr:phosphoribosylformylglycinamidine cyclo-ligase [Spirochaetia bacterium]